jgi:uncharacterized membrane protein YtjA (UPF0391 family)
LSRHWLKIAAKIPQTRTFSGWRKAILKEREAGWHIFRLHSCKYLFTLKSKVMLRWTVIFLIVAIIAAIFGFGGIAAGAASIAKILFFIFLVLFILSLLFGRRASDV